MKIGKAPENILIRSVLKQLKRKRVEVIQGPALGEQNGILDVSESKNLVLSTNPFIGTKKEVGEYGLYEAVNNVAITGAEVVAVVISLLLPDKMEEKGLKRIMEDLRIQCQKLNIDVLNGHTEVTKSVIEPILTVTAVGYGTEDDYYHSSSITAGLELVMTKWCGFSGTARLAERMDSSLKTRYPDDFLDGAKALKQFLSIQKEMEVIKQCDVRAIHHIAKGGVFGALWDFAAAGKVGLEIDLMKLPLKQETVEVCEFFDLNPYHLYSSGCLLIATPRGSDLIEAMVREHIPATVIGKTTKGNDRIIRNGEEERYLEPPKSDEINKIFAME